MNFKKIAFLFICLSSTVSNARVIELKNFPPLNGFESTLTYQKIKGIDGKLLKLKFRRTDNKNLVEFPFRFYQQLKPAPLIFLLTGLGGDQSSETSQYLSELLFKNGYHVVLFGSTFSPEFLESASSIPYAGQAKIEASDLYNVMYNIKGYLDKESFEITGWGLTGYSYGALVGAHIARLDSKHKIFNFKKYLLINPPVDVYRSLNQLDQYYKTYKNLKPNEVIELFFRWDHFNNVIKRIDLNDLNQFNTQMTARLSPKQMESILGKGFNETLKKMLKSSDQLLNNKNNKNEAFSKQGFSFYASRVLVNYFSNDDMGQKRGLEIYGRKTLSIADLNKLNSLTGLESTLKTNQKIMIFHNRDDFLIDQKDLNFLNHSLKDRLYLFTKGGHVGNLWHREYQAYYIKAFHSAFY